MPLSTNELILRVQQRIHDPDQRSVEMHPHLPYYPPVSDGVVDATEATLGFALPPLLRILYTQVGNGGFGPGNGLVGLEHGYGGHPARTHDTVVKNYHEFRREFADWPECLIPICDMYIGMSCINCSQVEGPIYRWMPNGDNQPVAKVLFPEVGSLYLWLKAWLFDPVMRDRRFMLPNAYTRYQDK